MPDPLSSVTNTGGAWQAARPSPPQGLSATTKAKAEGAGDSHALAGELKAPGLTKIFSVMIFSRENVRPFFRGLGFTLASGLTFPARDTSKHYFTKAMHEVYSMVPVFRRLYFSGERVVGGDSNITSKNVSRRDILEGNTEKKAGEALKKTVGGMKERGEIPEHIKIEPEPLETKIWDGICAGLRLDIAKRHILGGTSIREIVEQNRNGAPAEAAANQAVYDRLDSQPSKAAAMQGRLEQLKQIAKGNNCPEIAKANFDNVGRLIAIMDREIRDCRDNSEYIGLSAKYRESSRSYEGVEKLLNNAMEEAMAQVTKEGEHPWLMRNQDNIYKIKDFQLLQDKAIGIINEEYKARMAAEGATNGEIAKLDKEREGKIKELKWAVGLMAAKEEKDGPEPQMDFALKQMHYDAMNIEEYGVVVQARGLQLSSVDHIMGHSTLYASDKEYLSNLGKLPPGVYAFDFDTKYSVGHSITLVIEEGGKGSILDPTGFPLEFDSPNHANNLLRKLMGLYGEPNEKSPISNGEAHHRINITKFDAPNKPSSAAPIPSH